MGTVEFFEHTADVGLRVRGNDLDDLFRTAAEGLFDFIVVNRDQVQAAESERVELQADEACELLVEWLNELIFRAETRHRLYTRFDVHVAESGQRIDGQIGGEPIDRTRHVLDHEVKAVTRHGLVLERSDTGWVAELILDI